MGVLIAAAQSIATRLTEIDQWKVEMSRYCIECGNIESILHITTTFPNDAAMIMRTRSGLADCSLMIMVSMPSFAVPE